jgi:hypothetical protein
MATPVEQVLLVCGATDDQFYAFETREQLDELQDYADLTASELAATVSSLSKRTQNEGKRIIPTKLHKNIKALCFGHARGLDSNYPWMKTYSMKGHLQKPRPS